MTYQGFSNWDTWETWMVLSNSQPSYNWLMAWRRNWMRKKKKGTFRMEKATLAVRKYLVPVARGSRKPIFGDPYKEFTPDPEIKASNVNHREIVEEILQMET